MDKTEGKVKGIVMTASGGPEVLVMGAIDIDSKSLKAGQALIKIKAVGVNFIDVNQRSGRYPISLPYTPGMEAAGIIEALGEGDSCGLTVGQHVAYCSTPGSYAEKAVVACRSLIPVPANLSFEEAAAFPLQGMTAQYLLHEYRQVRAGDHVLVHAAAGGMGLLLGQWLKHKGAVAIGTTSSDEKARAAKEAGYAHIIDYTREDFVQAVLNLTGGKGCPLVIDSVGKTTFEGSLKCAAKRGTVIIYGSASGFADPIKPNDLQNRSITVCGGRLFDFIEDRTELLARAAAVIEGLEAGWLKLTIGHTFPLAEATAAHQLLESRRSSGKILLTV